jgi:hypothetical protein
MAGTITNGPAMNPITVRKRKTNGRSTIAAMVAEVSTSRRDSSSRITPDIEPVESLRACMRIPMIWSKSRSPMRTSTLAPAPSMKELRSVLTVKSNAMASDTPMANAISESVALFGSTRS